MEFFTGRMIFVGCPLTVFGFYYVGIAIKVFIFGKPHIGLNYKIPIIWASLSNNQELEKQLQEYATSEKTVKREGIIAAIGGATFVVFGLWNLFSSL